MTTEAKLDQWIIDGIEFEAKSAYDPDYTGKLPAGIVRNPNDPDLFFFSPASFAETELQQLVDDGYLYYFYPQAIGITQGSDCFCVMLALNPRNEFYRVKARHDALQQYGHPTPEECVLCKRSFPFVNDGDNVVQTHPGTGPTYSCGGTPPDYEPACTECMEADPEDDYPEPDEEDLWEARGLI
jgi:hypothetical protein